MWRVDGSTRHSFISGLHMLGGTDEQKPRWLGPLTLIDNHERLKHHRRMSEIVVTPCRLTTKPVMHDFYSECKICRRFVPAKGWRDQGELTR